MFKAIKASIKEKLKFRSNANIEEKSRIEDKLQREKVELKF